jgi:transcriptional regulator
MYQPPHFREDRIEVQHALIRARPLGLLITAGVGGLQANQIPFVIDAEAAPHGILRAHLARANPQLAALDAGECMVVFQGPQAYITPTWYATKHETGKVVPTWNYATVHVWGTPRTIDEPRWVRAQIEALTRQHEGQRPVPWHVDDAPAGFVEAQLRGIVGIEIPITRSEGKWKVSQNRPEADRRGVYDGVAAEAPDMAALVAAYGKIA